MSEPTRDATPFRLGALRAVVAAHGEKLDRAVSPRAYIVFPGSGDFCGVLSSIPAEIPWEGVEVPAGTLAAACTPVDGDIFVLIAVACETGLHAARRRQYLEAAGEALREAYPNSRVMSLSEAQLDEGIGQILTELAADPILVVPNGAVEEKVRAVAHRRAIPVYGY